MLLETRTWSKPYLSNPFPYLFQDVTQINKEELEHCKQTFLQEYRKYSEFKSREVKQIEGQRQPAGMLPNKSIEELLKASEEFAKGPKLAHVSKSMDIQIDRGIMDIFK